MADADLIGTVVGGKYRIRSKIGAGSMGDVFEADGPTQPVALKVLKVDDETIASRFLREAKTMSLFQHPNIVELLEVGSLDDGRLYFAAELVRGITVRAWMEAGPVDTQRALAIVRQVLGALDHAHAMGVVHRDIKPENVMIAENTDDHVKILDFGVAKLIGDTPAVLGEGTLTVTGYGALGTPYYISPEAVLGRVLDARADLYSIGVMLFELLAGKPPYAHDDVAVLMRMHAAAPIPKLAEHAPDRQITPELELVVSEALAKKPELRFKSAAEMISAVDAALRSLEPLPLDAPKSAKSTDLFGALPMKAPAKPEPSASTPTAFSPSSIPSASQPVQQPPPTERKSRVRLPGVTPYETPVAGSPAVAAGLPPARPGTAPASRSASMPMTEPATAAGLGSATGAPGLTTPTAPGPAIGTGPSLAPGPTFPSGPSAPPSIPQHPPTPSIPPSSPSQPVVGMVAPLTAPNTGPLFSPPMPAHAHRPSKLALLAQRHRTLVLAGIGAFVVIIIVAIAVVAGGGKSSAASAPTANKGDGSTGTRSELVKSAQDKIAAGLPAKALEILEAEPLGDDAEAYVVLGHARATSNRRLDGLAAYERAIALDNKYLADPQIRAHVERILESKDTSAAIVALELATRLDPPLHDVVKRLAGTSKNSDVRRRAFAIAEREKFSEGIDAVASWSLDLTQASSCEERLAAVLNLKRAADPKALPALKRAKTHRCVEREVAEAIAAIEQQQQSPSAPANP